MSGLTGLLAAWFTVYESAAADMRAAVSSRGECLGIAVTNDKHALKFQVANYRFARASAALKGRKYVPEGYRSMYRKARAALAEVGL